MAPQTNIDSATQALADASEEAWGEMGQSRQDYHRRRATKKLATLKDMLSRCEDRGFLQLAWSVNMLQSGFGAKVDRYLHYPLEAATEDMSAQFAVHKWDLETILTLLLTTPKRALREGEPTTRYALDQFATIAEAVNLLRSTENYEAGAYLRTASVWLEMTRIGYRQFEWQRGFATRERLYRYTYIYGQGDCAAYFEEQHGLSLVDFLKVGFYLFVQLHHTPWSTPVAVEQIGIDVALIERALPLFTRDMPEMRSETTSLMARMQGELAGRVAYLPSALRRYPVIRDPSDGSYIAPLPQLVMYRMTVGLFYDIASGPQRLLAEANGRFEDYVGKLVAAYNPRFQVLPSQSYGTRRLPLASPDVLVGYGEEIVVVIECKATKLTYEAQFADDPVAAAKGAFVQLVKGITQLWRFFSHVRRGIYDGPPVATNAHGILLTMDAWMQMAGELRKAALIEAAKVLGADPDVTEADKRPVVFCSMQDLADVMIVSTEDQFLLSLKRATDEKYEGWDFSQVRRDSAGHGEAKRYPFDIAELLPWWAQFDRDPAA